MDDKAIKDNVQPTRAPEGRVVDVYFGTPVSDEYRWLEDATSESAHSWLAEQASHARSVLDALPEQAALQAELYDAITSTPSFMQMRAVAGRVFYLTRYPGKERRILVMQSMLTSEPAILFDPNEQPDDRVIDWFVPSHDGSRLAIGISAAGTEASSLQIFDVASHTFLNETIPRVHFGRVEWLDDHQRLLYLRFPVLPADAAPETFYTGGNVFLHCVGDEIAEDKLIFGPDVTESIDWGSTDWPRVVPLSNGSAYLGEVAHGTSPFKSYFLTTDDVTSASRTARWTPLVSTDALVTSFASDGTSIYLLSFAEASQGQVLAIAISNPTAEPRLIFTAEERAVLEDVYCIGSALLLRGLHNGTGQLWQVALPTLTPEIIELPWPGTILNASVDAKLYRLCFALSSWFQPPSLFHYEPVTHSVLPSGRASTVHDAINEIMVEETVAPGRDGTPIPLSIIWRKHLPRNGARPTVLFGYGSFGIAASPRYMPEILPWLRRGGIFAVAHLRGGGEYGRAWHEAGRRENKPTTISDFEACADYLINEGYTSPESLAAYGASAGGIPASVAVARKPDRWGALILPVPVLNPMRLAKSQAGTTRVEEYGSADTIDGFKSLLAIDGYHQLRPGVPYPPTLVIAGLRDPRVAICVGLGSPVAQR